MIAAPPAWKRCTVRWSVDSRSWLATCVCVSCCLLRLYVPNSCVELRSGCGCDFRWGCWWKRATLHVSHGGPAMSAWTCFLYFTCPEVDGGFVDEVAVVGVSDDV